MWVDHIGGVHNHTKTNHIMKYFFKSALLVLFILAIISCTENKIDIEPPVPEPVSEPVPEVNDFIWRGLNSFYLWQKEVVNLSDTRFSSLKEKKYIDFLNSETDSKLFFENLLYKRNGFARDDQVDKWSWIVDDYIALGKAFQGISKHNGMEFGLVANRDSRTDIFGYVRYVIPDTDAAKKEVKRGMIFNGINGEKLTRSNFRNLLFSKDFYTIDLANFNEGEPISNGKSIELSKFEYQENPVFITKTITSGDKKIGYLMYNSFTSSFDTKLNDAFSTLKADGITDLIIDLRYNGGGSVRTAVYLSSMITGQFNKQLFATGRWNSKQQARNSTYNFTNKINNEGVKEAINSLNLTKVYFITTNNSASASELVINSLKPYIDVRTVGTKTHGKYVGSITLYDSPSFSRRNGANTNHKWAMQPIVLELVNKLGESNRDGLIPDKKLELREDYGNLGVLGEVSDPLLQMAITDITQEQKEFILKKAIELDEIYNSKLELPTSNNMYVEFKQD